MKRGILLVISGSSGVGKSTIIRQVLQARPDIYFSISFTTRPPREGEQDGVHYHFVSQEEFQARIARDEFLEYASYVGNYYGTSKKVILEKLEQGVDVLLDIEVQGAAKVREKMPEASSVFVVPPSFEVLSQRLRGRGTETEEKIQQRLETARQEARQREHYQYIVINETVEQAADEVLSILKAESCRTEKRLHMLE